MSEEQQETLSEDTAEQIAIDEGIEAIRKIHSIERQMLSRAIQNICQMTGKTAEEVVIVLADGLDEEYEKAMKSAYASSETIKSGKKVLGANKRKLYIPNN